MKFNKPALTVQQQLQKWESRGLVIADRQLALHYLRFIGYYRLSGYTLPFQQPAHVDKHFRPGTSFEQVLSLYIFDRELRLLVLDAIERIEVAVRTCLVNEMSLKHGPHWFMDAAHFKAPPARPGAPGFRHGAFLDKLDEELGIPTNAKQPVRPHNEVFINHYYAKYGDPYLPPAWMIFEVLPLGRLSLVFANLRENANRAAIASGFGIDEQLLQNWLHCLSYVRNICAHHRRLWNLQLVIKPVVAKRHAGLVPVKDRFYAVAVILHFLLATIALKTQWHERLKHLLDMHAIVSLRDMGFPDNWQTETFWGFSNQNKP